MTKILLADTHKYKHGHRQARLAVDSLHPGQEKDSRKVSHEKRSAEKGKADNFLQEPEKGIAQHSEMEKAFKDEDDSTSYEL